MGRGGEWVKGGRGRGEEKKSYVSEIERSIDFVHDI